MKAYSAPKINRMGRSRYKVLNEAYPYFHTLTVTGWQPVFTRPESVQILFDSFNWLQENTDFKLHAYVILENHLHFIATASQHGKRIQQFKSFTARQILDLLAQRKATILLNHFAFYKRKDKTDSRYQFWQESSHPEEMSDPVMLIQRLEYIHNNPVKRGYVDLPEHLPKGHKGVIPVRGLIWGSHLYCLLSCWFEISSGACGAGIPKPELGNEKLIQKNAKLY